MCVGQRLILWTHAVYTIMILMHTSGGEGWGGLPPSCSDAVFTSHQVEAVLGLFFILIKPTHTTSSGNHRLSPHPSASQPLHTAVSVLPFLTPPNLSPKSTHACTRPINQPCMHPSLCRSCQVRLRDSGLDIPEARLIAFLQYAGEGGGWGACWGVVVVCVFVGVAQHNWPHQPLAACARTHCHAIPSHHIAFQCPNTCTLPSASRLQATIHDTLAHHGFSHPQVRTTTSQGLWAACLLCCTWRIARRLWCARRAGGQCWAALA